MRITSRSANVLGRVCKVRGSIGVELTKLSVQLLQHLKKEPHKTTSRTYISAAITLLKNNTSRVAGPNPPHFAPLRNCSLLDTYTKSYTRIAPWLTLSACAGSGLLRGQHFSAPPRSQIAPRSTLGFQHLARIAPYSALAALTLHPDCSVFSTCRSVPCTDCSALVSSRSAPATNCSVFDT